MRHLPHRTLPRDSHVLRCFCVWARIPHVASKVLHGDGDRARRRREIEKRPYGVPRMGVLGQGYPLASYRPGERTRREQFVQWTFTPAFDAVSPAVAEIIERARRDKAMLPFEVDSSIGSSSWSWPEGQISKQKLAGYDLFDPEREFFKRGTHMPLMVFMGASNESRRSEDALRRRAANAARRGWTSERRQSTKVESESPDGADHLKGNQKGKGMHARGAGKPSDGKGKGGKGGARGGGMSSRHW